MFRYSIFLALASLAVLVPSGSCISCRDENNNEVDWLISYKLPSLKNNTNKLIKRGAAYSYISSNSNSGWQLSSNKVSDLSGTPFYNTFAPIYANASGSIGALFYNDQPPFKKECSSVKGHSKGVVMMDDSDGSAIWVVHSVPHFPPANGSFVYPSTGFLYGQHFFCVSLKSADLNTIGDQFMYTRPCYYGVNMTAKQFNTYNSLASSANGNYVKQAPWQRNVSMTTRGGVPLIHFAKYTDFKADLYSDFVAPSLATALRTETWQNDGAADRLASTCNSKFTVENILALNFTMSGGVYVGYHEQNDHAKWAVAVNWQSQAVQQQVVDPVAKARSKSGLRYLAGHPRVAVHQWKMAEAKKVASASADPKFWVCLGDINREITQFKRPGGTLCIYNQLAWTQFNNTVSLIERCP